MLGLGLTAVLLLACLLRPTLPIEQKSFRYPFILDITQSIGTPDYHLKQLSAYRPSLSKLAVHKELRILPCNSEACIGLFTIKEVLLLLDPLKSVNTSRSWMARSHTSTAAWLGNPIAMEQGLYGSILAAKRLAVPTHLVFITDGKQNVKEVHRPPLNWYYGMISGFLFGAGDLPPSSIPKAEREQPVDWAPEKCRR